MTQGARRQLLRPSWLVLHAVAVLGLAVMIYCGFWQWGRGADSGSVRNYLYGAEWWAFAALSVVGYIKYCLDETAPGRKTVAPVPPARPAPSAPVTQAYDDDPELAAWNAHLADLARRDAQSRR